MSRPLKKRGQIIEERLSYHKQISKGLQQKGKSLNLHVGDSVLKAVGHVQRGLNIFKFVLKWKGPYIIREAYDSGYYLVCQPNSEGYLASINSKWRKMYYPWCIFFHKILDVKCQLLYIWLFL